MAATTLTITIPGRVAPTQTAALEDRLQHAVQSVLGTAAEIDRNAITLDRDDARVTGFGLLTCIRFHSIIGEAFGIPPLRYKDRMAQLAHRLIGDGEVYVKQSIQQAADHARADSPVALVTDELGRDQAPEMMGLSREQECAADGIAAKHGRSHVRPLADGAVEITGLLDDIERETVCVNRDGTERWRR